MENMSPGILILIFVAIGVVALAVGYFLGSRFGGKKSVAMREVREKHDGYKNDVREHFEQTSAIMSRMVDDYRDMYKHMAEGAEKLAEMHPEKLVTPPPAPETITRDTAVEAPRAGAAADPLGAGAHDSEKPQGDGVTGKSAASAGAGATPDKSEADATKPRTATASAGKPGATEAKNDTGGQTAPKTATSNSDTVASGTPEADAPKAKTAAADRGPAAEDRSGDNKAPGKGGKRYGLE